MNFGVVVVGPCPDSTARGHELRGLSNYVEENAGILTEMNTVEAAELFGEVET